jgi:simple sugar transport system ATP-binding protein
VPVQQLSGGNIARLILARETSGECKLLIAFHPTFGLDVAATEEIRKLLLELRRKGVAILLVSEDLEEIMQLSDRIAVMYRGTFMGIVDSEKAKVEEIGLMMGGVKPET